MTLNPLSTPDAAASAAAPAPSASGSGRAMPKFTPIEPMRILRQYFWLLLITAVVGIAAGTGLYFVLLRTNPVYRTAGQIEVRPPIGDPYSQPERGVIDSRRLGAYMGPEIANIQRRDVLAEALRIDAVRQTQWYQGFESAEDAIEALQEEHLQVGPVRNTPFIEIALTGSRRGELPVILRSIMTVYLNQTKFQQETSQGDIRRTFTQERQRAQEDIEDLRDREEQFYEENDIIALDRNRTQANQLVQRLEEQKLELEQTRIRIQEQLTQLQQAQAMGRVNASAEDIASAEADPIIQSRDTRLLQLQEERDTLLAKFGANHDAIRSIDQRITSVRQLRDRELERVLVEQQQARLSAARSAAQSVQTQIALIQERLAEAKAQARDVQAKFRTLDNIRAQIADAQQRRDNADQLLNTIRVQIMRPDAARISERQEPTPPRLVSPTIAGTISGTTVLLLALVGGVVVLKELLDQRVRAPSHALLVPGAKLLGVLPDSAADPAGDVDFERAVVNHPAGLIAESFRQVRSALGAELHRTGHKVIVMTCTRGGRGTSSVVQNLAASCALHGQEVLLIDANFLHPTQHRLNDVDAKPGLIDLLTRDITLEQATRSTDIKGLSVLPAGNLDAPHAELFDRDGFDQLIQRCREDYDIVLIDAPPALLTSDSVILAQHCDATVFVVRAVQDRRGMIARMVRELDDHGGKNLGMILTGVQPSAGGYFRESYREFYRYANRAPDAPAPPSPAA